MRVGNKGIELIKRYEGCRLRAYLCPAGVPTIGYGHTAGVKIGDVITGIQAEELLKNDVRPIEAFLSRQGLTLTQNQFDALVSFCFNCGCGAFQRSSLRKAIVAKAGDDEIRECFLKWTKANGKTLPGLVKRRTDEANLFLEK
ncbi:MAG: lysozyme [Bacteroidales bacterium]|nr:lysozyme [Bacteroidales bacterium]